VNGSLGECGAAASARHLELLVALSCAMDRVTLQVPAQKSVALDHFNPPLCNITENATLYLRSSVFYSRCTASEMGKLHNLLATRHSNTLPASRSERNKSDPSEVDMMETPDSPVELDLADDDQHSGNGAEQTDESPKASSNSSPGSTWKSKKWNEENEKACSTLIHKDWDPGAYYFLLSFHYIANK
jgi:hypothetical protein